jgi:hypothetical protein
MLDKCPGSPQLLYTQVFEINMTYIKSNVFVKFKLLWNFQMKSYFLACHRKPFISQNLTENFDEILFTVAKHESLYHD